MSLAEGLRAAMTVFMAELGALGMGGGRHGNRPRKARKTCYAPTHKASFDTEVVDLNDFLPPVGSIQGAISIFAHLPGAARAAASKSGTGAATWPDLLLEGYSQAQLAPAPGTKKHQHAVQLDELFTPFAPSYILLGRKSSAKCWKAWHTGGSVVQLIMRKRG